MNRVKLFMLKEKYHTFDKFNEIIVVSERKIDFIETSSVNT